MTDRPGIPGGRVGREPEEPPRREFVGTEPATDGGATAALAARQQAATDFDARATRAVLAGGAGAGGSLVAALALDADPAVPAVAGGGVGAVTGWFWPEIAAAAAGAL